MSVNNEDFMIEQESITLAQRLCNSIKDTTVRNRAMSNVIASKIAEKYFDENNIAVDIDSGLYNLPQILLNLDISDIYIKGNYVDVRVYFNDNELCVPKAHFIYGMAPVAYMFIKLDESLTAGQVTGFILSDDITDEYEHDGYYAVPEQSLKSYYDVEEMLATATDPGIDALFKKKTFDFLDGKSIDLGAFYRELVSSESARIFLSGAIKTQAVMSLVEFDAQTEDEGADNLPAEDMGSLDVPDAVSLNEPDEILELGGSNDIDDIVPLEAEDVDDLQEFNNGDELVAEVLPQEQVIEAVEEPLESPDEIDLNEQTVGEPLEAPDEIGLGEQIIDDSESFELQPDLNENEDSLLQEVPSAGGIEQLAQEVPADLSADEEVYNINVLSEEPAESNVYEELVSVAEPEEPVAESVPTDSAPIAENDEINELSKFDYSTEIMPSISSIEENDTEEELTEELLEASSGSSITSGAEQSVYNQQNADQINTLFSGNNSHVVNTGKKKKKSSLPLIGLLLVLGAAGYFGYTKYFAPADDLKAPPDTAVNTENALAQPTPKENKTVAMPIETVENVQVPKKSEEGTSVSIPAIEKNLNASIQVSNLAVTWEVPSAYANNATAKRYLVKLGKVLQLNLKTELLIISKSPINNVIPVEIEFIKDTNKFRIKKRYDTSGVPIIDNAIDETINRTLDMNMNINMSVFNNLQGNPVLMIRL